MIKFNENMFKRLEELLILDDRPTSNKDDTKFFMGKRCSLYFQKDGTTYIKTVNHSMIDQVFPDDTEVLMFPLISENKTSFEIMASRISLNLVEDEDFYDVFDFPTSTINFSKKSNYILEFDD